jgi:hypothetical protein
MIQSILKKISHKVIFDLIDNLTIKLIYITLQFVFFFILFHSSILLNSTQNSSQNKNIFNHIIKFQLNIFS